MRKCIVSLLLSSIFFQGFTQGRLDSLKQAVWVSTGIEKASHLLELSQEYHRNGITNDSSNYYAGLLRKEAEKNNNDELKSLGILYESFWFHDSVNYDHKVEPALELAKKIGYNEIIPVIHLQMGIWNHRFSRYEDAIACYENGFASLEDTKKYKRFTKRRLLTKLSISASSSYRYQGLSARAAQYALEGSRLAIEDGYPSSELKSYINLSSIYGDLSTNDLGHAEDQKRYTELSRQYLIKAYELSQTLPDQETRAICAYNLGTYYSIQQNYDSSNYYLAVAEKIGDDIDFKRMLCNLNGLRGVNFKEQEVFDSAVFYLNKGLKLAELLQYKYQVASMNFSIADAFFNQNMLDSAIHYSQIGMVESEQVASLKLAARSNEMLSRIYAAQKDFEKSLEYYKLYDNLQDSIANSDNYAKIEELNARYEATLNERKLSDLAQTNQIQSLRLERQNVAITSGIVVFGLLVWIIYFYLNQRLKAEKEKSAGIKQKLLRSQMNPHFIFNALSSIRGYLYEDKDLRSAIDYMTKFSKLMRMTLEHTSRDWITLEEELAALGLYLDIQQMRFKAKFEYKINGLEDQDMADILVPPLLAQPFVENSIEHGFRDMMTSGKIEIFCKIETNHLSFHIEDNGVGIKHSLYRTNHESKALKIFKERIEILSKKMKSKMEYTIQDLRLLGGSQGTRVKYLIPLNTKL